ncbi:MAG: histidine phosphatase family protein [Anaerolineae bacterium]
MITVYLVRHGQSTWNVTGRIQGKQDPPLSALGRRQAEALADVLRHEALDAVYCSPQRRARMTADAVAAVHQLPVRTVQGLAEIDHGYWEGLTEAEIQQRFGISFYTWLTRPGLTQMPGGEHCLAVQQRVLDAWLEIVAQHDGDRVLVVSHDIPIKVIIADVLHLSLDYISHFVLNNTAISLVQGTNRELQLIQLNDRCHLDAMRDA